MIELVGDKDKHQWFTPVWAAEMLVQAHFGHLGADDFVVEPTAGVGNFLKAIPADVRAIGVELDPELAAAAQSATGRPVISGDFTTVTLPERPTAVVGNPPFDLELIDMILDRCHDLLPNGGKAGFILPSYAFQTASRLVNYARRWSVEQEMIPRNLFKNMMKPLCFAVFAKDGLGTLRGFSLYRELHDVNGMSKWASSELNTSKSPWKSIVTRAVSDMGGEATLADIYDAIEPRRPTENKWWQAKVRQTLGRSGAFKRVGESRWALAA
jgi:site-specific DNA-methyltransferase (adenine-specific)